LIIAGRGVRINSDAIVLRGALPAKFEAVAPSVGLVIVGQRECRAKTISWRLHALVAKAGWFSARSGAGASPLLCISSHPR